MTYLITSQRPDDGKLLYWNTVAQIWFEDRTEATPFDTAEGAQAAMAVTPDQMGNAIAQLVFDADYEDVTAGAA